MKRIFLLTAAAMLAATEARAQTQVAPQYVCGAQASGANIWCNPGNANGAQGLPVQVTGGSGGTTTILPSSLPETDLSGSITTGSTFQVLDAAASRNSFEFQNICGVAAAGACVATTDNCYVHLLASAATKANSILVQPGAYYGRTGVTTPNSQVQVTCDGTGDKFWAQKQ